jgi:hypothetical protein
MPRRLVLALCVLGFAVFAPGCQKVNIDKTIPLSAGSVEGITIDAPRGEQKIRVSVTSAEPVDVDVVLGTNKAVAMDNLASGKRPAADKVVASKLKVKTDTISATIPAGKEYAIVLSGAAKTTEVKLSVKSE